MIYSPTGELDIAKIIESKLCPFIHKGSWGELSEADGNFPDGDGETLRKRIRYVLVSQ